MARVMLLVGLLALVGTGCGQRRDARQKPTFPVNGRLMINAQPASEAQVTFVSTAPGDNFTPNPYARVKEDGSFELNTYGSCDGAPAGDYLVTIVWKKAAAPMTRERGPDLLRGRFADPTRSQLRVQVIQGPNNLQPFELQVDPKLLAQARN